MKLWFYAGLGLAYYAGLGAASDAAIAPYLKKFRRNNRSRSPRPFFIGRANEPCPYEKKPWMDDFWGKDYLEKAPIAMYRYKYFPVWFESSLEGVVKYPLLSIVYERPVKGSIQAKFAAAANRVIPALTEDECLDIEKRHRERLTQDDSFIKMCKKLQEEIRELEIKESWLKVFNIPDCDLSSDSDSDSDLRKNTPKDKKDPDGPLDIYLLHEKLDVLMWDLAFELKGENSSCSVQ